MDTNADDRHDRPDTHGPAADDMERPWTPRHAAAALYRQRWGWPVHASGDAVWLLLPMSMAAISIRIPKSRRTQLLPVLDTITGPVIDYLDGHYIILTHCTVLNAEHIGTDQHDSPVVHLGPNNSIDLPPSIIAGTTVIWRHAPIADQPLPACVATLTLARTLLAGQ
jgi:hypothetical protein